MFKLLLEAYTTRKEASGKTFRHTLPRDVHFRGSGFAALHHERKICAFLERSGHVGRIPLSLSRAAEFLMLYISTLVNIVCFFLISFATLFSFSGVHVNTVFVCPICGFFVSYVFIFSFGQVVFL